MRNAQILFKDQLAGTLSQQDDGSFTFVYESSWFNNSAQPPISLGFPKTQQEFTSPHLFPFFFNMIPEGSNKQSICTAKKIDQDDYFGILMEVAKHDTIGAVRVVKKYI
jgi:serine/threonine-protein kinase HipA